MRSSLQEKARQLRKNGWSYAIISERIGVAKSTLSTWLKDLPYLPNAQVKKRMKTGPLKVGKRRHAQKIQLLSAISSKAEQELGKLSPRDLRMLGIGLYIGEGSKSFEQVQLINADPRVLGLAIQWFTQVCQIPKEHFRLTMYLYPDNSEMKARAYWANKLDVPQSQFLKTSIDRRQGKSKKSNGKLPFGTLRLSVNSCGNSAFGVNLHRRIIGWIDSVYKQMRV